MTAEDNPVSLTSIAKSACLPPKEFEKQYKDHISGFHDWDQKPHADAWILFEKNIGDKLSIDETSVSNGELYTIITNKKAKCGKGALVSAVSGTKTEDVVKVLSRIPQAQRDIVTEVTLDMSNTMDVIIRKTFHFASIVTDRFHVQQLITEAVQEIRLIFRRKILQQEASTILRAKKSNKLYIPKVYTNGDTKKQLLARSRYLLFKPGSKWSVRQAARALILFQEFPQLEHAYNLSMMFRNVYEISKTKEEAKINLQKWYTKVEAEKSEPFITASQSIKAHEDTILNYFNSRSTNASAETFNAKLKGFRSLIRGVRDVKFFLFRVAKLYG